MTGEPIVGPGRKAEPMVMESALVLTGKANMLEPGITALRFLEFTLGLLEVPTPANGKMEEDTVWE